MSIISDIKLPPEIEYIRKLSLKSDDVLVFHLKQDVSVSQIDRMVQTLKNFGIDNKVLFMNTEDSISVISKEDQKCSTQENLGIE